MNAHHAPISTPIKTPPGPGEAVEIADGVLWLRLPLPMALDHVNVYAFDEGTSWSLVDTGFDTGKSRDVWGALLAGPLNGKPVRRVFVTHHHPDHIGLAGWFQSEHGAELVTTRTAWLYARMLTLDEQPLPSAQALGFWRAAGMPREIYAKRQRERPFNFADVVAPLPVGFSRVKEGDTLSLGGREWEVHIGNGHAPEHATLWSRAGDLVIGGDQLLSSISPNIGVYPTEPEADPLADWLESCARLAGFARETQLVLPGHKLPYTGLPARMRQLAENHHSALARLRAHLATPRTAAECFVPLFKREVGEAVFGLALVEAVAHLNHLLRRGEITRQRRDDGAWLWRRKD